MLEPSLEGRPAGARISVRLHYVDGEVGVAARAIGARATLAAQTEPCARADAWRDRHLDLLGAAPPVESNAPLAADLGLPAGETES